MYGGVNEGILDNELNSRTIRKINGKTNHFVVKQNARAAGPVVNVGLIQSHIIFTKKQNSRKKVTSRYLRN